MQWSGLGNETAIIGSNSNGNYFSNHPANGHFAIHQIVSCSNMTAGSRRMKRQMVRGSNSVMGQVEYNQNTPQYRCIISAAATITISSNLNLPLCPSSKDHLHLECGEFSEFSEQTGDCYRSKNVAQEPIEELGDMISFVSVCCYDQNE